MDPLSGVASVVAVIQLATQIGGALKTYYHSVRDARGEMDRLFNSLTNLHSFLEQVKALSEAHNSILSSLNASLESPTGPLRLLQAELENLVRELYVAKARGKVGRLAQRLQWPFKKDEVDKTVKGIEKQKSSLNLHLGLGNLNLQIRHYDILKSIQKDLHWAQGDQEHRNIVHWLSASLPDASIHHNSARSKHEETTGMWLIEGKELKAWITTKNSFIWLNGGAGAGKSILCSTVIDHLQNRHRNTLCPTVFWYFSFADDATQNLSNFLCSIVRDLCSNTIFIPEAIQHAYSISNNGQQRPTANTLCNMLGALLDNFDHVYLVIDALDEFPRSSRISLLEILNKIRELNSDALHFLATSRRETDIESSFRNLDETSRIFWDIKVQGTHVQRDIRKYIDSQFARERKFEKWARDEREQVKLRLSERADGMFRLVALQLDALTDAKTKKERRKALEDIPQNLDGFYKRILDEIPQKDSGKAKKAFDWLTHSKRPLRLIELAEAVLIDLESPYLDMEDRFDDEKNLLCILPAGLIKTFSAPKKYQIGGDFSEHENDRDNEVYDNVYADGFKEGDIKEGEPDNACGSDEGSRIEDEIEEDLWTAKRKNSPLIQFAHFSVQEYLCSSRVSDSYKVNESSHGHNILSSACSAYLLFVGDNLGASLRKDMIYTHGKDRYASSIPENRVLNNFPLVGYVNEQWLTHTKEAGENNVMDELFIKVFVSPTDGLLTYIFLDKYPSPGRSLKNYDESGLGGIEGIASACKTSTLLAFSGLDRQIALLLDKNLIPRPETDDKLVEAAVQGNQLETVKLLVEAGFDVNSEDEWFPLKTALDFGRNSVDLVRFLLEKGANANVFVGQQPGSLISMALYHNGFEAAKLLLEYGADITIRNDGSRYRNALEAAISSRNRENAAGLIPLLDNDAFADMLEGGLEAAMGGINPILELHYLHAVLQMLLEAATARGIQVEYELHLGRLRKQKANLTEQIDSRGLMVAQETLLAELSSTEDREGRWCFNGIEDLDLRLAVELCEVDKAIEIFEDFQAKSPSFSGAENC